ncbi:MAG: peptidoglycan DD-metalloendopeptidase family protein [Chloroflexota bacterium]
MFQNPPFEGSFPILQSFGDNPDFFRRFRIDGIEQRGHNGIDYQLPHGTPVLAVSQGTVLEIGSEPEGYGNYVVIGHSWGQTFYAHLSHVDLVTGATVAGRQSIGTSGDSGAASSPHLHFGLRIHPFSLRDGWFGFSNPLPYLRRFSQPVGTIIGPHIIGGVDLDLLRTWQPRMVLVLDPNPDEMRRLKEISPNTIVIGRVFATDHEVSENIREDPGDSARWAHSKTMERMTPHVDYWQFANEVLQHKDDLHLLNKFELERMALAEANGYRCAILGFSVGNPDLPEDDRMSCWEEVYPSIEQAEKNGHVIAVHQYGMPDLLGPDGLTDWLILRLEHQVLMRLPFKDVQFAVTEYGIDGLIRGSSPSGWKHFSNAEVYSSQLLRVGRYLERYSGRVLGYAVFTLGHYHPWGSYDIIGTVSNTLAQRGERGTWSEFSQTNEILGNPQGDMVSSPSVVGGDLPPDSSTGTPDDSDSAPSPLPPDPNQGGDNNTDDGSDQLTPPRPDSGSPNLPTIERRTSDAFQALNARIRTVDDRADVDRESLQKGDIVYLIKDVFTTINGSWEPSDNQHSIVRWARDDYLKPFGAPDWFDDAGADHHIFGAVLGLDGELIREQTMIYWSDGFDQLGNPDYTGYVEANTKSGSGWANQPLGPGSSFVPEREERGPWCWMPSGMAEVFEGGGLPANHHVSTFVVWQAVELSVGTQSGDGGNTDTQGGTDQGGTDGSTTRPPTQEPMISRRLGDWIHPFNFSIQPVTARADAAKVLAENDVVYLLKDLFTTRDGSWEQSDKPGSLPAWAREYLKPFGAPDYFDDAGGDRHLFAAVIGLDGELMKQKQIAYWSDGIHKLGDVEYDGFVYRETKDKSGWINIPIGPGSNFIPERGESGPWCWAPSGASDVVCGGGLPAKQHVSTFAVWQAVRKSEFIVDDPDTPTDNGQDDQQDQQGNNTTTTIFVPFISGSRAVESRVDSLSDATPSTSTSPIRPLGDKTESTSIERTGEAPTLPIGDKLSFQADRYGETHQAIRSQTWVHVGFDYEEGAPFVRYARLHELGMPTTEQFEIDGYFVQGYSSMILYAPKSNPTAIEEVSW